MVNTLWIDLGNVLLYFDFHRATSRIRHHIKISEEELYRVFFDSPLTLDFERGKLLPEEFYAEMKKLTGLSLSYEDFVDIWCGIFWENKEFINLFRTLNTIYRTILISNLNTLHYNYIKMRFPVIDEFDYQILSFKEGFSKPSWQIYERAKEYSLGNSDEILYIDDREDLIKEAERQKIRSLRYTDTPTLIKDLKREDLFIPNSEELSAMNRLRMFADNNTLFIIMGNPLRKDDALGIELVKGLDDKLTIDYLSVDVLENIPFKSIKNYRNLVIIDVSLDLNSLFSLHSLEDVEEMKNFSTHGSLIFFHNLRDNLNKNIVFFLLKGWDFSLGEGLSSQARRVCDICKVFFMKNFSQKPERGAVRQ